MVSSRAKIKKLSCLVWLSLAAACGVSRAANYANETLSIGAGARPLGMGGAFAGLADDSTALYWNPAGLTRVRHLEVTATQQGREADDLDLNAVGSSYTFLSAALTFPSLGSFGLGLMRYGVSDIPHVTGVDPSTGAPIQDGTFGTQDLALFLSYARPLVPALSAGLTLKTLNGGTQGLSGGEASYSYFGGDLGLLVDLGKLQGVLGGLSLGLNAQDLLNSGVAWGNTATNPRDPVAPNLKMGLAYAPDWPVLKALEGTWALSFDADPRYDPAVLYHLGSEFWYRETVALRGGARIFSSGSQDAELSGGLSFRFFMLQLDYAYVHYELTPVQFLSVSGRF
jgi:hypothetical protein